MPGMSPRTQIALAWCGPAGILLFLLAFWPLAGFIPPTAPTDSAADVAAFYNENRTAIRVGMVIGLPAALVLLPFYAGVSGALARIEAPKFPKFALLQICGAVILMCFFIVCIMAWINASYRAETSADDIRTWHDFGWLVFVMVWPEYTIAMAVISAAILMKGGEKGPWPRWFGFFTAWTAFSGAGGSLAVFFKDGAFAWNGIFGFYLPISVFVIWTGFCTYFMITDAKARAAQVESRPLEKVA